MANSLAQFQHGLSMVEIMQRYGNETKAVPCKNRLL